jgi:hypothetical protein
VLDALLRARDPVDTFADLPPTGNDTGDVRMVTALEHAFTWNGASWAALSVDQNGNLSVPGTLTTNGVQLQQVVSSNDPCTPDGSLARDPTGLMLYCRNGTWRNFLETRVTTQAYTNSFSVGPNNPLTLPLDLTAQPGTRPLLMTATGTCRSSTGSKHANITIAMLDSNGATIGYQGTCDAYTNDSNDTSNDTMYIGLAKLPANATTLLITMTGGNNVSKGDGSALQLVLFNSE